MARNLLGDGKAKDIKVEKHVKVFHGKHGPNRVFGLDVDLRKNFTDEQAVQRFEMVWDRELRAALEEADACTSDRAKAKLEGSSKRGSSKVLGFFNPKMEHREFKLKELEFLAQIAKGEDGTQALNQLWYVPSIDDNPKLLRVMFDTVREREYFRQLALKLGWNDEELGKWLVQEFMKKLEKAYPIDDLVAEKGQNIVPAIPKKR